MYHNFRLHEFDVDWDWTSAVDATFIARDSFNDAIQELIFQVARDLETLCMLRIPRTREDRMLLPSDLDTIRYGRGFGGFPKLRDLLFVGNLLFEPSQGNRGAEDDDNNDADEAGNQDANLKASNAPLFPALKHIHIAHCLSKNNNVTPFDRWVQEAPALETLRVTFSESADEPESSLIASGLAKLRMLSMFGGKRPATHHDRVALSSCECAGADVEAPSSQARRRSTSTSVAISSRDLRASSCPASRF